jgi:hypothetical protein
MSTPRPSDPAAQLAQINRFDRMLAKLLGWVAIAVLLLIAALLVIT